MNSEISVLLGTWLASLGALLGIVWIRKWRLDRQKLRAPVTEKLLRGPGEGLQKKLEQLEDQVSEQLAYAFILPLLCVSVYLVGRHTSPAGPVAFGVGIVGIPAFVIICRKLLWLLNQRRNYRLGLLGERAVAEELNKLMLDGCRVFHDVPNEPYGNVDHVLITPSGVYAVETKARRKKSDAKDAHKVTFDGSSLRFAAGGKEREDLKQSSQQASQLRDWLSKALGEPVAVQPVLALPGWWVEREGKGRVRVINGKEVYKLNDGEPVLNTAKIKRIAQQLDRRCRDVEF